MDLKHPIEIAIQIALEAHGGKLDKSNIPVIIHPLRVWMGLAHDMDTLTQIGAILHDVFEESKEHTYKNVYERFMPYTGAEFAYQIVSLGHILTHDKKKNTYEEYIENICKNERARAIKLADIHHNLTRDSTGVAKIELMRMHQKHIAARQKILEYKL